MRASEVQHTVGKLSMRSTSLLQTSPQSKVWAKSSDSAKWREYKPGQFRDSSLGVPRWKVIWMQVPWKGAKNTIWGKVVASPKSGPWWVLWVQSRPWLVLAPRCSRMWTNQLVVGWMQIWKRVIKILSLFLVPSRSSSTALYPPL
jgi:hypothetical protein